MYDDACRVCKTNGQIKFNTTMLKATLCDRIDAYILVKEPISNTWAGEDWYLETRKMGREADKRNNE